MSIEFSKNGDHHQLNNGQDHSFHCKDFSLSTTASEYGGKIIFTTDKGKVSEKRIDLELTPGSNLKIKSLGIQIRAN